MKAQVLYGINRLKYEENYREPNIRTGEVLVKVKACGICGSDIDRVLKNGTYHFPTIIGHEFSGEVVAAADKNNEEWIGKRVSVFPLIPCKECPSCLKGEYQLCENYNYLGSRCDGGFSEYVAVPVWNIIEIPEGITYEASAMLEPSSVALHTLKHCGNLMGKKVLITGSGTIASIIAQLAKAGGATKIVIAARNKEKLAYLQKTIQVDITDLDSIKEDFDIVIEGTGVSSVIEIAIDATVRQGIIVLMGNPSDDVALKKNHYWQIMRKELHLVGTWNSSFGVLGKNDWADVFSLLVSNRINLDCLITHRLKLNQLLDGILMMKNKKELYNKVMVVYE